MLDGTYNFQIDIAVVKGSATMNLRTEGDKAFIEGEAPIVGKVAIEGAVEDENTFTCEGVFKLGLLLGKVSYSLRGEVEGDDMKLSIETNKGNFALTGTRVEK